MSRATHEIFSLGKRIQHLLFTLAFLLSLLTGAALPGGRGLLTAPAAVLFGSLDTISWWHAFSGMAAAVAIGGHLLYLMVRGYIESIPWHEFPFRLTAADWRSALTGIPAALRGRPPALRYSAYRKIFYWTFLALGSLQVLTGCALHFWDLVDVSFITASLGLLGGLHGGGALVLAVLALWHLYETTDGFSRTRLALTAVTGRMGEEDLAELYGDQMTAILEGEEQLAAEGWTEADLERLEADARAEEREMVEQRLQEGNRLAREGRFLEAAGEYRRALERFPAYSQAQYNLAVVLEKAGKTEEALEAYRRFMEVEPFHPFAESVRRAIRRLEE